VFADKIVEQGFEQRLLPRKMVNTDCQGLISNSLAHIQRVTLARRGSLNSVKVQAESRSGLS